MNSVASQEHLHTLEDETSLLSLHTAALTHSGSHLVLTNYNQKQRIAYITLWDLHKGKCQTVWWMIFSWTSVCVFYTSSLVRKSLKDEPGLCCIALTDSADRIVFGVTGDNRLKVWEPFNKNYKSIDGCRNLKLDVCSKLYLTEGGSQAFLLSALSLADDAKDLRPPASVSPAEEFSPKAGNSTPTATTAVHNITNPTPTTTKTPKPTTTTTPKPTTTTTPKPTTTTTPKTTTTTTSTTTKTPAPPAPTPPTSIPFRTYNLTDPKDKKIYCLMAQMGLRIRLETKEANGTFIVQPNDTKTSGSCGETNANLTLSFKDGFITFLFNKSVANNTAYVDALSFNVPIVKGGNTARTAKNESIHLFAAKIGHSYSCRNESLYMGNGLYLDISPARMQAFNVTNNNFGVPDNCPADQPSYRVAIAVGVTLLVLILVVVVAYLLGRRKRTDGYQSL
ncbi:macrosialin-like isoform X2 [Acanthochromis polyacanthus]|uniref:macrosialin-like isoform X2 n=1 Tax=Acanthochromis polyacanthus TaxID=80966 RepID=UPI00223453D8|nr:macrosialin-like isoform X2 [Acanthochromis polyacanthus]